MSIIVENYENKIDKVWYNSSNIAYTECLDKDNDFKELKVVFNNGGTYLYKKVDVYDYIMMKHGGTDGSNGKALNKYIKPKYEFEKLEDTDMHTLREEMNNEINKKQLNMIKNNTYFISGHRDITDAEFADNYATALDKIVKENENAIFVVGDYSGVDILAQNYLVDTLGINPNRVTVYHMFDSPRNINPKIIQKIGGFRSDEERDEAMTNASFCDIAFVRDNTKNSGTAQNILRRFLLK